MIFLHDLLQLIFFGSIIIYEFIILLGFKIMTKKYIKFNIINHSNIIINNSE